MHWRLRRLFFVRFAVTSMRDLTAAGNVVPFKRNPDYFKKKL